VFQEIKKLWLNNRYRVWIWCWVLGDMDVGFSAWEEYRTRLIPDDCRDLCDLVIEEYDKDVDLALSRNPLLRVYLWFVRFFRDFSLSINQKESPF